MRRSASEIIRNLENRIARLEKKAPAPRNSRKASGFVPRRASRPMFTVDLYEETTTWIDEDKGDYEQETEEISSKKIDSFEDLLDYMKNLAHDYSWGEWSSSRPEVDVRRSDWITSYEEQDYIQRQTGDSTRASLHFNPSFGVSLDKGQIRQIEKALRM